MKIKRTRKSQTTPTPPPAATIVLAGKSTEKDIPEGGPTELPGAPPPLKGLFEMAISNFCPDVEKNAPEWARRAREIAVDSLMLPCRKKNASEAYKNGFGSGEYEGMQKLLSPETGESPTDLGQITIEFAVKQSPDFRADFFVGWRDGEALVRDMPNRARAVQTIKAYQAIAADWPESSKCEGNAGKLHQWLIDKGVIHFRTDPAATRKICRIIGFPTRGKAGSPRQEKQ